MNKNGKCEIKIVYNILWKNLIKIRPDHDSPRRFQFVLPPDIMG